MQVGETVTVYSFRVVGPDPETYRIAPFKAPRTVVAERFGGEVLEGTGMEVEREELDNQSRYRRVATGWGALA